MNDLYCLYLQLKLRIRLRGGGGTLVLAPRVELGHTLEVRFHLLLIGEIHVIAATLPKRGRSVQAPPRPRGGICSLKAKVV